MTQKLSVLNVYLINKENFTIISFYKLIRALCTILKEYWKLIETFSFNNTKNIDFSFYLQPLHWVYKTHLYISKKYFKYPKILTVPIRGVAWLEHWSWSPTYTKKTSFILVFLLFFIKLHNKCVSFSSFTFNLQIFGKLELQAKVVCTEFETYTNFLYKMLLKSLFLKLPSNAALSELKISFWTLYIEKSTKCKQTKNT